MQPAYGVSTAVHSGTMQPAYGVSTAVQTTGATLSLAVVHVTADAPAIAVHSVTDADTAATAAVQVQAPASVQVASVPSLLTPEHVASSVPGVVAAQASVTSVTAAVKK